MKRIMLLVAFIFCAVNVQARATLSIQATAHSVQLTWTGSSTPTVNAYGVMRGPMVGSETPLFTTGNVTTYTDTSVVAGQSYAYFVFATDGTNTSAPSNEVSVTVPSDAPPQNTFVMSAAPISLAFSGITGATLTCQSLVIDDTTNGPLPVTVTTDVPWLTVTTASGNTKLTTSVCVKTTGLAAGPQTGHVIATESAANPSGQTVNNSPLSIPVTLTLTAPVSTVTAVTVACVPINLNVGAKAMCAAVVSGTNSPSQAVTWTNGPTFTATAAGPVAITATSVQDATKSGSATVTVTATPVSPFPETHNLVCTTITSTPFTVDALGNETVGTPTSTVTCVKQ